MFRITNGKGFHITFENGWTVSVQFGWGNYCEHHSCGMEMLGQSGPGESVDAEIAVWGPDGEMLEMPGWGDTVKGYCKPAEVLELLNWAANQEG